MNQHIKYFSIFTIIVFSAVACGVEPPISDSTKPVENTPTQDTIAVDSFPTDEQGVATQALPSARFSKGWSSFTNANEITDIAFDQNGYLWAASVGGVTRWNLNEGSYERYTVANGLPSNNITAIQPATDGSVWIGTQYGEIARLEMQEWQTHEIPELSRRMEITDIHQDKSGNIWFSTYGAGAIKYDGQQWKVYLLEDGIASVAVSGIVEDNDGNLWFETRVPCCDSLDSKNVHAPYGEEYGIKAGVSKFDGETWEIYLDELGLFPDDFTYNLYSLGSSGNDIWISSSLSQELIFYNGNELIRYPFSSSFYNPVLNILSDNNDNTWFVIYKQGVVKFDGNDWIEFNEQNGLLSNDVSSIAIRADDNVCFGTKQGISCLDGNAWTDLRTTDVESSMPSMHINDFAQDSDGVIWLATTSGVVRFDGQEWKVFSKDDGLPVNDVRNISVASDGSVWIRVLQDMDDIILSYDGEKWEIHDYGDIVWFIDFAQDGAFWAWNYDDETLSLYNGQQRKTYPSNPEISFPEKIIVTSDSQIWVFQPYEVVRFDGKTWDLPYLYNSWITGMALSPNGKIWLASEIREQIDGQSSQTVGSLGFQSYNGTNWDLITALPDKSWILRESIVFSPDGTLWVCADDGVYNYFNDEWNHYTIQDGLSGNSATAIYSTTNGELWFVTEGGLTLYNGSN